MTASLLHPCKSSISTQGSLWARMGRTLVAKRLLPDLPGRTHKRNTLSPRAVEVRAMPVLLDFIVDVCVHSNFP